MDAAFGRELALYVAMAMVSAGAGVCAGLYAHVYTRGVRNPHGFRTESVRNPHDRPPLFRAESFCC